MVQYQIMILAFFESIKYVGHLLPLAFLRIYLGFYFFDQGLARTKDEFLIQPRLAATISEWLPQSGAADWYKNLIDTIVVPNWKIFAYLITYCDFLIGVSFIIGFLVRPVALLGIFLALNFIYSIGFPTVQLHQLHLVLFVTLLWLGAGRCLGLDYFFYKRQRGIWW